MAWHEVDKMESRRLFVTACGEGRLSVSAACRQYDISRVTGYKWLERYEAEGSAGLADRSRRPQHVVYTTPEAVLERLVALRMQYPYWGVRKLCCLLAREGLEPPPERTANRILKRQGLVGEREHSSEAWQRFERSRPNALWQVDHKRAVHGRWSRRSVPLVVVDDASRYLLGLRALPDKGLASTWSALWAVFGEFGLPEALLSDNDGLFHGRRGPSQWEGWLMRLGIAVLHGRPYHPQTQGKVERLNGTVELEVLRNGHFHSAAELQHGYDAFRARYNFMRPHEALEMQVPGSVYQPSVRPRPAAVPAMEYSPGLTLRCVQKDGWISWRGWSVEVGEGLRGERVEVRETEQGLEIYYGRFRLLGWTVDEQSRTRKQRLCVARSGEAASPLRATPSAATPPKESVNHVVAQPVN